MDLISISCSIAALLQLTSTVIQYLIDVGDASENRREVLNEVICVSGFLFVLKELSERAEWTGSWCTTIMALNVPDGPLEQFKRSIEHLASKLGTKGSRKAQRALAWPFQKGEIKEILHKIERQKALFVLALANDHVRLSLEIKNDIERVQDGLQRIGYQISRLQLGHETWLQDQESSDLLAWLSPLNFWTKQNDLFSRRQDRTGEWLLKHEMFDQWLNGIERTLWCYGIPGAGKTILASVVINYLEQTIKQENVGIAYIYCTYRERNQTAGNLVASLLKQLIQQRQTIPSNIRDLYRHHRSRQTHPPLSEYSRLLQAELRHFLKVFIAIDALDECSEERGIREHFLAEVQKLLAVVRLLVTSRHMPDIERKSEGAARLEICASDGDVKRYLESRIKSQLPLASYIRTDPTLRSDILTTIIKRAHGMFLLAKLHMDSLGREDSRRGVKRALQGLPEELDRTYEEAMKRIQSQDPRKVRRAEQVLSWICYAIRPMTVNEIQCALAVEPGDTDMDEEALPDEDLLVSVCAGLVTIDRESNVIRFVHYTAREYFVDRFRTALTDIVRTCLTYLSFNKFADGYCRSDEEMEIRLQKYPLLCYASQYWGDHARGELEQDQSIKDLIIEFLENEPKISCSVQLTHIPKYRYEGYSQRFPKNVSRVELAAALGLEEITRELLEKGSEVNRKDSDGGTALHWAAWGGHERTVQLLLEKGADVHAEYSSKATPLHWAAEGGHESLVRLLLEKGAHIAIEDVRKWTPMHRAAWKGYDVVVQLFLEKGVDINTRDSDGGTALHGAAENGHEAVVRLLLDKGADVNSKDLDGGTPLHRAAWNGHKAVVRLLLEKKADVSAKYSYGGTAKRRRSSGQEVVVRLLLEKGADVAAKYFRGGTALHWAAWSGHEEVVRLLLDSGADFTVEDSDGGTALYGAAESGHEAVVQLLLEKWRELSLEDPDEDAETAVRRLLERGTNSAVGEAGGPTALHWAAWGGREAAVRPLLEDGANINARNLNGRTALHWAAWSGHEAVVRLLLEMGADISIKDNGKWTALHWAAWNGHGAVVQLLLEKGADIATKDSDGKTASDWADAMGHKAVVQLLLENGADIAAEDTGGQDALVQLPLSKSSSTIASCLQPAA